MLRTVTSVLLATWVALIPALAGAGGGTLGAFSGLGTEWAVPLSDEDLADQRGGFAGLPFGVAIHFEGAIGVELGEGIIHVLDNTGEVPGGLPDPSADNPDAVEIREFLGSFAGFNGIGQWAVVNGNNNNVTNQLTVNIFITDALGTIATFPDVLSPSPAR
jgi:hypothetical protein